MSADVVMEFGPHGALAAAPVMQLQQHEKYQRQLDAVSDGVSKAVLLHGVQKVGGSNPLAPTTSFLAAKTFHDGACGVSSASALDRPIRDRAASAGALTIRIGSPKLTSRDATRHIGPRVTHQTRQLSPPDSRQGFRRGRQRGRPLRRRCPSCGVSGGNRRRQSPKGGIVQPNGSGAFRLDDLLHAPHLAVLVPHLDAVGMCRRFRQEFLDHPLRQGSRTLVLLEDDPDVESRSQIASSRLDHGGWNSGSISAGRAQVTPNRSRASLLADWGRARTACAFSKSGLTCCRTRVRRDLRLRPSDCQSDALDRLRSLKR